MLLRAATLAISVLFGAQAVGLLEALSGPCEQSCDDDDNHGRCPPTCSTCSCAPRMNQEPSRALIVLAPPAPLLVDRDETPAEHVAASPPDGVSDEIPHVPILG